MVLYSFCLVPSRCYYVRCCFSLFFLFLLLLAQFKYIIFDMALAIKKTVRGNDTFKWTEYERISFVFFRSLPLSFLLFIHCMWRLPNKKLWLESERERKKMRRNLHVQKICIIFSRSLLYSLHWRKITIVRCADCIYGANYFFMSFFALLYKRAAKTKHIVEVWRKF